MPNKTPEFELKLSEALHFDNKDKMRRTIVKSINNIRTKNGLAELSLSFFEESKHPRDHGKFASKGGSGGSGSEENNGDEATFKGESYNRKEVRNKIKEGDAKERLSKILTGAKWAGIIGGGAAAVATGHPIIAAALFGYGATKIASKMAAAATYATAKYGTKTVIGANIAATKITTAPSRFILRKAGQGISGIVDAVSSEFK